MNLLAEITKTCFLLFSWARVAAPLILTGDTDAMAKDEFLAWFQKHCTVASGTETDLNYLNHLMITTKSKKLVKGKVANDDIMKEILNAETVTVMFDKKFSTPTIFPMLFCRIPTLRTMYLKNLAIPKSMAAISILNNLEELELHSCVIENISSILPVGSKLKKLTIRDCSIIEGEIDTTRTPKLETLVINDSDLASINKEVFMLKGLKKLDFKFNHLSALPLFDEGDKTTTQELLLTGNIFKCLGSELNALTSLKKLDLSKNVIEKFEKDFEFSKKLPIETLDLSDNLIKKLPANFHNLKKIKSINLSSNYISAIDVNIFRIPSLEKLNLSVNNLQFIDESITPISSLIYSYSLVVSGDAPFSLKELDLSYNSLIALPNSFMSFVALEVLNLEGNALREVPVPLRNHRALRELNLAFNRITSVSPWIADLPCLCVLNLKGGNNFRNPIGITNNIKRLPMQIFHRGTGMVTQINLQGNTLAPNASLTEFGLSDIKDNFPAWVLTG